MKEKILSGLVVIAFIIAMISGCSPNSNENSSEFQDNNLNVSSEDTVTDLETDETSSEIYDYSDNSQYQGSEQPKKESSEQQTELKNSINTSEKTDKGTVNGNNTASSPSNSSVESSSQEELDDASNISGTSSVDWEDDDVWGPRG